uniref:lysoplasmalogenase TMEM86A-like n=1 Tax=Myxine glutinosa TaxID=7769 RepID=UPI00358FCCAD
MKGKKFVALFGVVAVLRLIYGISPEPPILWRGLFKCLPILLLIPVALEQAEMGVQGWLVTIALILSAVGDICIFYKESHFLHGTVAFGVAHLAYIATFGLRFDALPMAVALYLTALTSFAFLWPGLLGPMVYVVPIYCFILATMAWRALAPRPDGSHRPSAAGAMLFMASDLLLSVSTFRFPVQHSEYIVDALYYGAQLCFALSPTREAKKREHRKV